MNWLKFKLKKICTIYQVTNSFFFNENHSSACYLNSITQILKIHNLTEGIKFTGYTENDECFSATFLRTDPSGDDIECVINFQTTTLTITIKE